MVITGLVLIRFYFNPKVPRLHKKKWVPVLSVFVLSYGIYGVFEAYQGYSKNQIPSKNELEKSISDHGVIATEDISYTSQDGYEILIPANYTYITSQHGRWSLTARKDYSALLVAKYKSVLNLSKHLDDISSQFKKSSPTVKVLSRREITGHDAEVQRVDLEMERQGVPVRVTIVFFNAGETLYQLNLTGPKLFYGLMEAEFERIINSFIIK